MESPIRYILKYSILKIPMNASRILTTLTNFFQTSVFIGFIKKCYALVNMHKMLKKGGEILIQYLLVDPCFKLYECMDAKWKKYTDSLRLQYKSENFCSHDEVEAIFIKAGFQIIHTDSSLKKYTFPDFSSLLNKFRPVDGMYNVLPPSAHDEYSMHVKEKIRGHQMLDICQTTGKATLTYQPITVHAKKM